MSSPSMTITMTILLAPLPSLSHAVTSFFLPALDTQPYAGSIIHTQAKDALTLAVSCDSSALSTVECALPGPATITASGASTGHLDMSISAYGSMHIDCTGHGLSGPAVCQQTWTADKDAATAAGFYSKYGACTTITTSIGPSGAAPRTVNVAPRQTPTQTQTMGPHGCDCDCEGGNADNGGGTVVSVGPTPTPIPIPTPTSAVAWWTASSEGSMTTSSSSTTTTESSPTSSSASASSPTTSPFFTDFVTHNAAAKMAGGSRYQMAAGLCFAAMLAVVAM